MEQVLSKVEDSDINYSKTNKKRSRKIIYKCGIIKKG